MALTPIDVQQKTFGTSLRGYDLDEVDEFLDDVVVAFREYENRLAESQRRIAALETEVAEKTDVEGAIARALVTAQRSADAIVADARTEAERLLEEARLDAERLLAEANDEAAVLAAEKTSETERAREEIGALRAAVDDLRGAVRSILGRVSDELAPFEPAFEEAEARIAEVATIDEALIEVSDPGSDPAVDEPAGAWREPEWDAPAEDAELAGLGASDDAEDAELDELGESDDVAVGGAGEDDDELASDRIRRPWEDR